MGESISGRLSVVSNEGISGGCSGEGRGGEHDPGGGRRREAGDDPGRERGDRNKPGDRKRWRQEWPLRRTQRSCRTDQTRSPLSRTRGGGGSGSAGERGLERAGLICKTWNTGCTLREAGRSRRTTAGPTRARMGKGPTKREPACGKGLAREGPSLGARRVVLDGRQVPGPGGGWRCGTCTRRCAVERRGPRARCSGTSGDGHGGKERRPRSPARKTWGAGSPGRPGRGTSWWRNS